MFLSLKHNSDDVATALGMGSAIAATAGVLGIAGMFAPVSVFAGVAALVGAILATEATANK